MVKHLSEPFHMAYSQLVKRCSLARSSDLARKAERSLEGGFVKQERAGRTYWYFQVTEAKGRRQHYVGPDSDSLRCEIERHASAKQSLRERRQIISFLRRAGLPAPDLLIGRVLEVLDDVGAFHHLRAVVVGTVAYQAYAGLLGVKLAGSNIRTAHLELAHLQPSSMGVPDVMELPLLEILQRADARFELIASRAERRRTCYAVGDRYRIDILFPTRVMNSAKMVPMPALEADAHPLQPLDFLTCEEEGAVILHVFRHAILALTHF